MQLKDAFCYLLFTITIASSYVTAEDRAYELSERKTERRISKRDAAIFIDNFPIEPIYKSYHRPKVVYRRISKQKYRSTKPVYGPPPNKYRSKPRKPIKKYRGSSKPKYGPPSYKRRPTKPKYGPPKPVKYKTVYGPPKKAPQDSYYVVEPTDFGEPPVDLTHDFQSSQHNFGEPPLDSYGSPLSSAAINPYIPEQHSPLTAFSDTSLIDNLDTNFGQDFKSWQSFQSEQSYDNNAGYSKKHPIFIKPEPFDPDDDFDFNTYKNFYKQSDAFTEEEPFEKKRKPQYLKKKLKTKSRKPKPKPEVEPEDEVLVGGHYAEPPARLVPKYEQSISWHSEDDEFEPLKGFIDPNVAISATNSPYVNYKHSNMAFSPQNLNDAFSIIE